MADQRSKRYSPPTSRLSTLPTFGSLSPIGQSNGTKPLGVFTSPDTLSQLPGLSPTMEKRNNHRNSEPSESNGRWMIRIRRLPRNFTEDALRSMLLFATDLDEAKFVHASDSSSFEESGFNTALAVFNSEAGATEAKRHLHGKSMDKGATTMIVEIIPNSQSAYNGSRRNTVDGTALRQQNNTSGSSNGTNLPENTLSRQSSRFTSSFQQSAGPQAQQGMNSNSQKINSPLASPMATTAHAYDFPAPDSSNRLQGLFSPQSPVANAYSDNTRISGKSLINDGNDDDETGELLKDPIGYAQSGRKPSTYGSFVPQFGNLSLDTNTSPVNGNNSYSQHMVSPSNSSYVPPQTMRSPTLPAPSRGPTVNYASRNLNLKHDYPPVNPADQNPPCNTLYVGNLPVNTSEDELKSLFSKSRGFKRLCFRTKQNGPMCFVEYEDITYASHALHELYGVQLHNSYKGGIRVSFSKNPLGVRSDTRTHSAMNAHAGQSGYGNGMGAPPGFSTAAGPPPGLMPPGIHGQQPHAPPAMQNNAGRGYPPQYRGISPHNHPQQGTNGYHQPPRNLSSGQYAYQPPTFGSMNSFMANPVDANFYSNGTHQNGINGHNGR